MMMYNSIMVLIRKNIKIIIALSFSIIVCAVVWFFVSKKNLPRVDYMIGNWHGDHAVRIDNGYAVSEEIKDSGETVDFIWGPYDLLKKGSYTAHIEYSAEEDQSCQAISALPLVPPSFLLLPSLPVSPHPSHSTRGNGMSTYTVGDICSV